MCEIPLTPEQRIFAAKHHGIIYKFLMANNLSIDDFYDVVIFSYLKAVRNYFAQEHLKKYSFSTIAWKSMSRSIADYKKRMRRNQATEFVSIHTGLYAGDIPLEESIPARDDLMLQLEMKLLLHDLSARLSKQQMDIIHLKSYGYGIRDIAHKQKLSLRHVKELLEEARIILLELCNE